MMKSQAFGIGGFLYGALLSGLGFIAGAAGHGSDLLLWLVLSPLSLVQFVLGDVRGAMRDTIVLLLLIVPPIFWAAVGAVLGGVQHRRPRIIFLVMILAHYGAIPIRLIFHEIGEWEYAARVAAVLVPGVALYAAGQVAIWIAFFRIRSTQD